jgi:hypothetical protein
MDNILSNCRCHVLKIGVRQTEFGDEGNCLRACIATICQVELDEVVDVLDGVEPEANWFLRIERWARERGYELDVHMPDSPPSGWSIAIGETVRGPQTHAVVAYNGVMWWDPHPSDLWLIKPDHYMSWTKSS